MRDRTSCNNPESTELIIQAEVNIAADHTYDESEIRVEFGVPQRPR